MAASEFDLEQMKNLLQNLAEKLANTKGDEAIVAKLGAVEKALANVQKQQEDLNKKNKTQADKDRKELIKDLVSGLDKADLFKGVEDAVKNAGLNGAGAGQGKLDGVNAKDLSNMKGFAGKAGAAISAFGKLTSGVLGAGATVVKNSEYLNGSFKGLAQSVGLSGGAFGVVAEQLDKNNDAFRDLLTSSEGTITGIMQMRDAASKANLTIEEFAKVMKDGTDGTRLIGGQNWLNLYKGIQTQTKSMGYYGYTTKQMMENVDGYLATLTNGNIFNREDPELIKGLDALLVSSDRTASILGKTRDDMKKRAEAEALDTNFKLYQNTLKLTPENQTKQDTMNATVGASMGPTMEALFKDLALHNGRAANKDNGTLLNRLNPEAQAIIKKMVDDGNKGKLDDVAKNVQELAAAIKKTSDTMAATIARNAMDNVPGAEDQAKALSGAQQVKQGEIAPAATTPGAIDEGSKQSLEFEQRMKELQATVQQGVTELMRPMFNNGELMKKAGEGIDAMNGQLRQTVVSLGNFDTAIKILGGLLAGGALINAASGIVAGIVATRMTTSLAGILTGLGKNTASIAESAGGLTGAMKNLPGMLRGAVNTPLGAAGVLAVGGPIAAEIGSQAGDSLGTYLVKNHPEMAAWMARNVYGQKVDENAVVAQRDQINKDEAQKTIDDPNADAEAKKKAQVLIDGNHQNPNGIPEDDGSQPAIKKVDLTDTAKSYLTRTANQAGSASEDHQDTKLGNQLDHVQAHKDLQEENDGLRQQIQVKDTPDPQLTSSIDPAQPRVNVSSLDHDGIVGAIEKAQAESEAITAATNAALDRIYAILKQQYDITKDAATSNMTRLDNIAKGQQQVLRTNR